MKSILLSSDPIKSTVIHKVQREKMKSECFPDAIESARVRSVMRNFPDNPDMVKRAKNMNAEHEEMFLDPLATYTVGPLEKPPGYSEVEEYFDENKRSSGSVGKVDEKRRKISNESFVLSQEKANAHDNLIKIFSLEIHSSSRQDLQPDPDIDQVSAIFYSVHVDDHLVEENVLMVTELDQLRGVQAFRTELEMIASFVKTVQDHDPDLMVGHDVERGSWGYLMTRGQVYNLDMRRELSRVPHQVSSRNYEVRYELSGNVATRLNGWLD